MASKWIFGAALLVACSSSAAPAATSSSSSSSSSSASSSSSSSASSSSSSGTAGARSKGTFTLNSCPAAQHCGGDPKGTWDIAGGCQPTSMFLCAPDDAQPVHGNEISGSVVIDDTNMTWDLVNAGAIDATLPVSCFNGPTDCASLATTLAHDNDKDGRSDKRTATCTGPGPCSCAVTYELGINGAHLYAVTGASKITAAYKTVDTTISHEDFEYCVTGDEMVLSERIIWPDSYAATETGNFQIRLKRR